MHPALSVILFTTLSGAGYGVLLLVGLGAALAPESVQRRSRPRRRCSRWSWRQAACSPRSGTSATGARVARVLAVAELVAFARGRGGRR
jgi:hypothetical protein